MYKPFWPCGKGTTLLNGFLLTTYKSWDDPPSSQRFSLPQAELKRVLGEGGVHGLEEAGDHVEGSWEDNIFCFGRGGEAVGSQKKSNLG